VRTILRLALVPLLAGLGCGSKKAGSAAPDAASATKPGASAAGSTTGGAPASQPVPTAEGGAVAGGLPVVTDCPKSLAGPEKVARTIKKECGPIPITGDYSVDGSLTLEAGAVLKIADGASIWVGYNGSGAKLIVKGTEAEPVLMTSAGDPVPGAWKMLALYKGAARSRIEGLVLENAGTDDGALRVDAEDIVLKGSTLRNLKGVGLFGDDGARFAEMGGNTFSKAGKIAASFMAATLGGLGANKLEADAVIMVRGGHVEDSAKWQSPGAPYLVVGDVDVDGKNGRATLEIGAGTELRFKNTGLSVGYNADAILVVSGTADKPVVFTSGDLNEPGAWKGVWVYGRGDLRVTGATFQYGGAQDDAGAVMVDGAPVAIAGSTFKDNLRSVNLKKDTKLKGFEQNRLGASKEPALRLFPDQVGGLGAGNVFDKDAHIEVSGGEIKSSVTWQPMTVPYEVTGEISVGGKGTLTLAEGVDVVFADNQQLSVGYTDQASLKVLGTAAKPVQLRGSSWKGVYLYGGARGCELANVQLAGVTGDAGIIVEGDAEAKVTDVACAKCQNATLTSKCGAKLTATGIKAGEGTPKDEIKPTCQ
jgi:hypothetical protein